MKVYAIIFIVCIMAVFSGASVVVRYDRPSAIANPYQQAATEKLIPDEIFGITITPVSDISNSVIVSSTSFFLYGIENPLGYMLAIIIPAIILILIIRDHREKMQGNQEGPKYSRKRTNQPGRTERR